MEVLWLRFQKNFGNQPSLKSTALSTEKIRVQFCLNQGNLVSFQCVVASHDWSLFKDRFYAAFLMQRKAYRRGNGGSNAPSLREGDRPRFLAEEWSSGWFRHCFFGGERSWRRGGGMKWCSQTVYLYICKFCSVFLRKNAPFPPIMDVKFDLSNLDSCHWMIGERLDKSSRASWAFLTRLLQWCIYIFCLFPNSTHIYRC